MYSNRNICLKQSIVFKNLRTGPRAQYLLYVKKTYTHKTTFPPYSKTYFKHIRLGAFEGREMGVEVRHEERK